MAQPEIPSAGRDDLQKAAQHLHKEGVVYLPGFFDRAVIDEIASIIEQQHPEFSGSGKPPGYLDNGDNRFLATVTISARLKATGIFDDPALDEVLRRVLGADYQIEAFRLLMAQPGCPDQEIHRDAHILFPELSIDAILPAIAVSFFFPLIDVDAENGLTEFVIGSQRKPHDYDDLPRASLPHFRKGDALMWDYRLMHRGLGNRSARNRAVLNFNVARPWWTDYQNYGAASRKLVAEPAVLPELGKSYARAVSA